MLGRPMNDTESELSFDVPPLVSLSRQIEVHLERLILQGTLKSGQRLSEPDIAKRFRTSRSPVREALRRLEQVGLVVIEPRRGASVKAPSERDIADMLAIREALEGMAARLAAERADAADIARLQACVEEVVADGEDPGDLLVRFHEVLVDAACNVPLRTMLRGSLNLFRMVRATSADHRARLALAANEHFTILDAIVARDPDAAEKAARQHIRTLRQHILGAGTMPPADDGAEGTGGAWSNGERRTGRSSGIEASPSE